MEAEVRSGSETGVRAAGSAETGRRDRRLAAEGPVPPRPSGLWGHALGWASLKRLFGAVGGLFGTRRRARLELDASGRGRYEERLVLFGVPVRSAVEVFRPDAVASVRHVELRPSAPLVLGALVLFVGGGWGAVRFAEGLVGRSAGLVFAGLGAVAASAVADFLLFLFAERFGRRRWAVEVLLRSGRALRIEVDDEAAARDLSRRLLGEPASGR